MIKRLKAVNLNIANIHFFKLENFILYVTLICYFVDIGNLKYVIAMFGAAIMFLIMLFRREINQHFFYEFKSFLLAILGLATITFVLQAKNGFNSYAINEIIYFITPLFFAFSYLQVNRGKDIEHVLNIIFLMLIVDFLVRNFSSLSLSGILSISIVDSYSPYEGGLPFYCVIYMIYFFYKDKLSNAIVAWIFNFLSLKRLSLLCATILLVIMILKRIYDRLFPTHKRYVINKRILYLIVIIFILIPLVIHALLNDEFQEWFYNTFGIDIDTFMLSRFTRMEVCIDNPDKVNTGLGSSTVFLTEYFQAIHTGTLVDNFNMHNDIFKIYVECGLLGTIIFTVCYFRATKFKAFSVLLMSYVFTEMIVNHLLGAGTVSFWIVFYLILYRLNQNDTQLTCKKSLTQKSLLRKKYKLAW